MGTAGPGRPPNQVLDERIAAIEVNGRQLAEFLGITEAYLSHLAGKNLFSRNSTGKYPLKPSIRAFIDFVRGKPTTNGVDERPDGNLERALLWREQREAQALRNAALRGELLPSNEIREVLTATANAVKAKLLAIPSKGAPLLLGEESLAVMQHKLTELVYECCDELAAAPAYEAIADHAKRLAALGGDVDGAGAVEAKPLEAPAPPDRERMGGSLPPAKSRGKRRARNVAN